MCVILRAFLDNYITEVADFQRESIYKNGFYEMTIKPISNTTRNECPLHTTEISHETASIQIIWFLTKYPCLWWTSSIWASLKYISDKVYRLNVYSYPTENIYLHFNMRLHNNLVYEHKLANLMCHGSILLSFYMNHTVVFPEYSITSWEKGCEQKSSPWFRKLPCMVKRSSHMISMLSKTCD